MHEKINSTNHLFKLFNDSEGVFYTLTPEGEIRLRNLKAEDKDFSVPKYYNNECDGYNYLYFENFTCNIDNAQGSDYFRAGCVIKEGMKIWLK